MTQKGDVRESFKIPYLVLYFYRNRILEFLLARIHSACIYLPVRLSTPSWSPAEV